MDYKAASYMIVCQLAVKVVMEAGLVNTLAVHVSKSLLKEPVMAKEGIGCLIVLLQNQKEGAVGPRCVECLRHAPYKCHPTLSADAFCSFAERLPICAPCQPSFPRWR